MEQGEEGAPRKKNRRRGMLEWAIALAIALVIALVLTQVIFVNAQVPTPSMEDTIVVGDRVLGYRLAYLFEEPKRGDIAIFRFPDDETQLFVKRVIGLPGEVVEIADGAVLVDGVAHPELNAHVKGKPSGDFGPFSVPPGSYFMMGDNRTFSFDSRYWTNTYVARDAIVGKAILRIFPNPGMLE